MMARTVASFRRTGSRFKPQPRVLVLCEDTKSSKNYLHDASIYYRSHALVEFAHCGRTDPLGIVQAALDRQSDFDSVYCVIDRDDHKNFDAAVVLASGEDKVSLLTSYPCFEFWLLLHFCYSRSPFTAVGASSAADRVIQELRTKPGMATYAKGDVKNLFQTLLPKLEDAKTHASRAMKQANEVGELNPSTPLHLLLERLRSLADLQST